MIQDRLTLDEGRATAAQILEIVHGLVLHRMTIMVGAHTVLPPSPAEFLTVTLDAHGNESAASILRVLGLSQNC